MAPLETRDLPGAPQRSAVELVGGLEATWQMIQTALVRWTPADLDDVFAEVQNEQTYHFTRQQLIWASSNMTSTTAARSFSRWGHTR